MKVKVKYVGNGISSRGVDFKTYDATKDNLYVIPIEDYEYLSSTFGEDKFILIEKIKEQPAQKANKSLKEAEDKPKTKPKRKAVKKTVKEN